MKDKQLFQKIKTIIKQKDLFHHEQKSRTFAQKYCKQQLLKRKLNPYNPNHKMNHLMQHFKGLQTYISLPQLIDLLNLDPAQEDQKQILKDVENLQKQKPKENLLIKIKKLLSQQIRQKYIKQNQYIEKLLKFLENSSSFKSEGLKNSSENNLNYLYQQVLKQRNDILYKDDFDFLKFLQKTQQNKLENTEELLSFEQNTNKIKETQIKIKKKKQTYNLLRKIVTYLQIIQQSQHKEKWSRKYQKANLISQNTKFIDKNNNKTNIESIQSNKQHLSKNKFKFNTILQPLNKAQQKKSKNINKTQEKIKINSEKSKISLQLMKQKHFHQQNMSLHLNKYHWIDEKYKKISSNNKSIQQKCKNSSSFYNQSLYKKMNLFKIKRQKSSNENLMQKNKQIIRNNFLIKKNQNQNNKDLKKSFTFRNRNIKQKIINKLSNFIRQIDEQQIINKRQITYYNSIIEKLDKTLRKSFNQLNQQSITNSSDFQQIKTYAGSKNIYSNSCNVPLIQGKLIRLLGLDSDSNLSNGFQKTSFN